MALESNARKTEHNGAKNSSHDKPAPRADLKAASRKLRRQISRKLERSGSSDAAVLARLLKERPIIKICGLIF